MTAADAPIPSSIPSTTGHPGAAPPAADAPWTGAFALLLESIQATPASAPSADPRGADGEQPGEIKEKKTPDEDEQNGRDEGTDHAGGDAEPPGVASAPLTIHSLNRMLLRTAGGESRGHQEPDPTKVSERETSRRSQESREATADAARQRTSTIEPRTAAASAEPAKAHPPAPPAEPASASERAHTAAAPGAARTDGSQPAAPAAPVKDPAVASPVVLRAAIVPHPRTNGAGGEQRGSPLNASGAAQSMQRPGQGVRISAAPRPASPTPSRAEMFQAQLARGLAAAIERGKGTVTLHLKPESLGRLNVRVSMQEGVLTARFEAETRAARDLLVSTTGQLRQSLEAAGLSVERIEATIAPPAPESGAGASMDRTPDAREGGADPGGPGRDGAPDGDTSGRARDQRDTDVAPVEDADDAAEPPAEWLALGIDTLA